MAIKDDATEALLVKIVSGGGGGGGGTQYAEDAPHTSGDTGTLALVVRKDAVGTLAGTDGDYAPLQVDNTGALRVAGAGGGQQYAEDSAHVSADLGTMALAIRQDSIGTLSSTTGDYTPLQTDATGALRIAGTTALTGEDHIGEVGGNTVSFLVTPTLTSGSAYTQGLVMGGRQILTNAMRKSSGTGTLQSVTLLDQDNQKPQLDILIFDADFTAAADHATWAFNTSGDWAKLLGFFQILTSDWYTSGSANRAVTTIVTGGIPLQANGTQNLYMVIVNSGTTNPTFTTTTPIRVRLGMLRD